MEIRFIIAGSRRFNNYAVLYAYMLEWISEFGAPDIVVSGCADGADALGERWARTRDIPIQRFPADWARHGKAAGPIRNGEMADYGTHLAAFPAKDSKGTVDMIQKATDAGLVVRVYPV